MSVTDVLRERLAERLESLRHAGRFRVLQSPRGIDLCSNDYLALSRHPLIQDRMIDAIRTDGCGSTGSRLLRGERDLFSAVERRFAEFKRTERALYFSSGYLANIAVVATFAEQGDVIFSDERNHASLIDAIRLSSAGRVVFPHNDVDALHRLLQEPRGPGLAFVATESLFSMDGDIAPLSAYAALCRSTGAALIVDEAHAVGVHGARGSGLIEETGVDDDVFVSVNTAGKALGVAGAFVAGSALAIEYLVQRARPFIFSTAPPPAVAAALEASLDVVADEPERRRTLASLSTHVRRRLVEYGIPADGHTHIIPILLGEDARAVEVARALQAQGFDVRAIRPPTVAPGTARLRVSVNVGLNEQVLDRFVTALAAVLERSPLVPSGLFVTGTDTGVGKTVVAAALMHRYRSTATLRYWKPIQTGIEQDDDTAEVERLGRCGASEVFQAGIRLPRPLSPHLAARLTGVTIDLGALMNSMPADEERVRWIVEGAGGVLVPINQVALMVDLMALLRLSVVVVARTALGTINHTLLSLEALRKRSLDVAGVVMVGERNAENRAAIEHFGGVTVLGEMPLLGPLTSESVQAWAETDLDREHLLGETFR